VLTFYIISQLPGNNTGGYFWSIYKAQGQFFCPELSNKLFRFTDLLAYGILEAEKVVCIFLAQNWKQPMHEKSYSIVILYEGNQNLMMVFIQSRK